MGFIKNSTSNRCLIMMLTLAVLPATAAEPAIVLPPTKSIAAKKPVVPVAAVPSTEFPTQLKSVLPPGGTIVKSFKAEAGLTGWIIAMSNGEKMVGYTLPAGTHLVVGALVNAKGENLTALYTEREIPKPPVPEFSSLEMLPYIQQGNGKGKPIYIFSDPFCGYCQIQEQLAELYESGDLNIRWIKVAVLSPNSGALGEAIYKSPNPAAAWKAIAKKTPDAISVTKPDMSPEFSSKITQAGNAMKAFGGTGTPLIVWQDDQGKIQTRSGVMGAVPLAAALKVPVAANISPDLAKFQ